MAYRIRLHVPAPLAELLPLLALGVGLLGLFGTARVAGELHQILTCSGAMGGQAD